MRSDFYQVTVWVPDAQQSADQFMTASQYCVRVCVNTKVSFCWSSDLTVWLNASTFTVSSPRTLGSESTRQPRQWSVWWPFGHSAAFVLAAWCFSNKNTHTHARVADPVGIASCQQYRQPVLRIVSSELWLVLKKKKSQKWGAADGRWLQPCVIWAAFRAGLLRRYGSAAGERWREGSWHADGKALLVCDHHCADTVTEYTQEVIFLSIVSLPLIIQDLTYSIF